MQQGQSLHLATNVWSIVVSEEAPPEAPPTISASVQTNEQHEDKRNVLKGCSGHHQIRGPDKRTRWRGSRGQVVKGVKGLKGMKG
jgi:hypothetical protein